MYPQIGPLCQCRHHSPLTAHHSSTSFRRTYKGKLTCLSLTWNREFCIFPHLPCTLHGPSKQDIDQMGRDPKTSKHLWLLVDPVELGGLPALDLLLLEPEVDLLLGVLDAVGAVADVAADVLCADVLIEEHG